jgi:hypothetical protein
VIPKLWVATRKWVAKPCHVGRQLVPPKKIFTQQRVATIEIVVHWVAKKPEKFKWVSGQKSLGTTAFSVSFRVVTPGGGERGGVSGGVDTKHQYKIFDDIFFTHFSYFQPSQSLLPSSPSSPVPSSRPAHTNATKKRKPNCSPLRPPGDQYGVWGKAPKKFFCQISPGGPTLRPGGLCPPPPGECLNETLNRAAKMQRTALMITSVTETRFANCNRQSWRPPLGGVGVAKSWPA